MTHNRVTMVGMLLMTSFCGGALASIVLGARVEAQGPQAVTTTQVNLVDEDGVLRAVLSASDERGTASLTFYDSDGRPRGLFGVERDGPVLRLRNAAGEPRVSARVTAEDALLSVGDDQRMHAGPRVGRGGAGVQSHGRRSGAGYSCSWRRTVLPA